MKKTYDKPVLAKAGELPKFTAMGDHGGRGFGSYVPYCGPEGVWDPNEQECIVDATPF
jgi:hypothetical protein